MKKLTILLLVFVISISLLACTPEEVMLECDGCGKSIPASAEMDNDWVIYCEECQHNLLGD